MLESGSSGSVRGVLSNEHSYREPGPKADMWVDSMISEQTSGFRCQPVPVSPSYLHQTGCARRETFAPGWHPKLFAVSPVLLLNLFGLESFERSPRRWRLNDCIDGNRAHDYSKCKHRQPGLM